MTETKALYAKRNLYELCAFPVRYIPIPGEDVHSIVIYLHQGCTSSPGMHILTGNAYPHRECT